MELIVGVMLVVHRHTYTACLPQLPLYYCPSIELIVGFLVIHHGHIMSAVMSSQSYESTLSYSSVKWVAMSGVQFVRGDVTMKSVD